MPVFELYNSDGSLQLDLSSRITKVLSVMRIASAGSFSSSAFERSTPYYCFSLESEGSSFTGYPTVSQNGQTMSWTSPPVPMYLIIGTY